MSFPDWREPARLLDAAMCAVATDEQRELAEKIGLLLTGSEPRAVVAAMLEDHLRPVIRGLEPRPASERQRSLLMSFGATEAAEPRLSSLVASAWISHHLALLTMGHLRRLALVRDDAVIVRRRSRLGPDGPLYEFVEYAVVSSIGANGRVHFFGGNGGGAWPSALERAPATSRPEDYPHHHEVPDDVEDAA